MRPSRIGPRGQILNHHARHWLKTVVVSGMEKARLDRAR
jgi:hypothetical protein